MTIEHRAGTAESTQSLMVGGRLRTYLQVGAVGAAARPAAVVLVLHGSSQSGRTVRTFSGHSFDLLAADGRATVVYPDGLKKLWNHDSADARAVDDVAFVSALVHHFHGLHGPVPVIVAGYSNGGQLLIRLIHEIPDAFDGAAIVSATLPRPGGLAFADKGLAVPVLLIHGTHDLVVPYGGEGALWGRFARNKGPSAPETAAYFAARNGITAPPQEKQLAHRPESGRTRVVVRRYSQPGCEPVALYTVVRGGHVVPNRRKRALFLLGRTTQDISAVEAMADFFPALRPS